MRLLSGCAEAGTGCVNRLAKRDLLAYRETAQREDIRVIVHCVFCQFRADVPGARRREILFALERFAMRLDGVLGFAFGPNRDFENKSPEYTDGFVVRFASVEALNTYAAHPTHVDLGAQLCDLCQGGGDGIVVFDIETP